MSEHDSDYTSRDTHRLQGARRSDIPQMRDTRCSQDALDVHPERSSVPRIHVDMYDTESASPDNNAESYAHPTRSSDTYSFRTPSHQSTYHAFPHQTQSGNTHARRHSSPPRSSVPTGVLFTPGKSQFSAAGNARRISTGTYMQPSGTTSRRIAPLAGAVVVLIALFALIFFVVSHLRSCNESDTAEIVAKEPARVSFIAVGDNLPENTIGEWADAQAGGTGDGKYDYTGIYTPIKDYVQSADLAYCKEETHCGGDELGARGYPSFNTTDAMADALVSTGFDLIASASNHCYDWGAYGANEHSCSLWSTKNVAFTGTYASESAYNTITTTTVNGITISLLDYTYGVNGYTQDELPDYCVKFIDEELIRSDVAKAHQTSDVVIVAMHWGTENQTAPDETQLKYAQLLADLDVDVILGSHPHVIGPLAWIEGKSGHRTLCAYSLGNFLSSHETPQKINELEGMLSCTFVKETAEDTSADASPAASASPSATGSQTDSSTSSNPQKCTVSIQDVTWIPLVNHTTDNDHAVYALKDYTEELAAAHTFLGGNGSDALSWLRSTTREVVNSQGSTFEIDDEPYAPPSPSPSARKWF